MKSLSAFLFASLLGSGMGILAQDPARKVKVGDFESDLGGWAAYKMEQGSFGEDADSTLSITKDPKLVKSGKGSLAFQYEVTPGTIRMLGLNQPLDLTGMKSVHLWVKCSHETALIMALTETGGASYQTSITCTAGTWQEVQVNLDEFVLDDRSKDPNGKLDLDQIGSLQLFDIGGFVATFLPDVKGSRTLWVDDFEFTTQAAPLTMGLTQVTRVTPVFLIDSFESGVVRWTPISVEFAETPKFSLFDRPLVTDLEAPPGGGKRSLKFAYPRQGRKIHGLMRTVEKLDLSRAVTLELWLKTSHDGTFFVSLEEKNQARYQKMLELKAADGWKSFSIPFREFTLAEDSKDDNGRLDADQLKQLSVADVSNLLGGQDLEDNCLWIDEVRFVLSP
jgi:hypothetical protein